MKTWQELSREYEFLSDACNDKKAELKAALIVVLQEKYPDFEIERKFDFDGLDTSIIMADGKEFYVHGYRRFNPELFEVLPYYPEIESLLYVLAG